MDARASKRQKIVRERNPFIDDKAAIDYDDYEDDTDYEDDFIQLDTTDDVDDMGIHARVNSAMRAADEEMVGEDMMLNDCSADPEELSSEDSDQDIELSPKDGVWEIRCMMDREWEAISTLLHMDMSIIKSATFLEDHPGRIYVEIAPSPTYEAQKETARRVVASPSLNMLTSTSMRFIPCPEAATLFSTIKENTWQPGMWARIRGPNPMYRGDIGFIFCRSNKTVKEKSLWVAVVPRIDIHKPRSGRSCRVPAKRLSVKDLSHYFGIEVQFGRDFLFRCQTFNYSGYLLYRLEELDLFPPNPFPPFPLSEEFEQFLGLPVLRKEKWAEHRLAVWQRRNIARDRVKLLHGKFRGMTGVVLDIVSEQAEVYLPHIDEAVVVGVSSLQLHLCLGDHIRVVQGEHIGATGFITKISADGEWIDMIHPRDLSELHILVTDVEFHTAPTVVQIGTHSFEVGDEVRATAGLYESGLPLGTVSAIHEGWLEVTTYHENTPVQVFHKDAVHTTNPKTNRVVDAVKKGEINMYGQYCGRHCIVISGPFKGHRGLIKTSHPDGRFDVELDSRREQLTAFRFDDILVQDKNLALALSPPICAFSVKPAAAITEKRPIAIVFPSVNIPPTPTWKPRYKAPLIAAALSVQYRRSDHPSLNLPVPTWLLSGEFVPHRIKLLEVVDEGPFVEYLMPTEDGSQVHIRDSNAKTRVVPVEQLRHLQPEKKNDIVVPLTGHFKGKVMKVKEFRSDRCTLTIYGVKRIQQKNYDFPRCDTHNLAIIAPPKI